VHAEVTMVDDLPEWELAFRFNSGRLCLAFCATVGERWRRSFERLREPRDLARWLVAAELARDPMPVTTEQLRTARRLREAIYRLVEAAMAGEPGLDADGERVNAYARRLPVAPQIGPEWQPQIWTGREAAAAGLASVARDAVELLTSSDIDRVRECDAGDCALLFWDASRPGRRRWCADGSCGSRSRSAAYRARRASTVSTVSG
jgi:predicted RNA-binding Zn ribbon-like protein